MRLRVISRDEIAAIAIYIAQLDTAIFNLKDDPRTTALAPAESKALQDKMRAIVKTMKDEVDGKRAGPRLNDRDAKAFFDDLSKTAASLKSALDKIAADVNQPQAVRDAAKARADRVKKWQDSLDAIKAGDTFKKADLGTP